MSELSTSAHVRLLIADYGVIDQQLGKITIVGGGLTIIGTPPNTEHTAPFAILAVVDFDSKHIGQRPMIELALEQENGQLVPMPGPPDQTRFVHIASNDVLKTRNDMGEFLIPPKVIRPRVTLMIMLQNGLPLQPGHTYTWRLKIDDETRDEWTEPFYVPLQKRVEG
jgi:hypothetical protein